MGLRFYEKYLLLFGAIAIGIFILSGTIVFYSSNNLLQSKESTQQSNLLQGKQRKNVRDLANRRAENEERGEILERVRLDDQINLTLNQNVENANTSQQEDNEYRKNYVKQV
jgi:ABC-type transport system involved in cytochrome bd biosynthesis fused ATPase/permease subunit